MVEAVEPAVQEDGVLLPEGGIGGKVGILHLFFDGAAVAALVPSLVPGGRGEDGGDGEGEGDDAGYDLF